MTADIDANIDAINARLGSSLVNKIRKCCFPVITK